jgi:hypothetical protein
LFEGKVTHRNIVRARIAMNVPNLIALRDLLINNWPLAGLAQA